MLSVIIPTHDHEAALARTLAALVPAAAEGVVREVVVADAGSRDGTVEIAEITGCLYVNAPGAWGRRIGAAVDASRRGPWLLVLAPGVVLEPGWFRDAAHFVERSEVSGASSRVVGVFTLRVDGFGFGPRLREWSAGFATSTLRAPRPEQGLLFSRAAWTKAVANGPVATHRDLLTRLGRLSLTTLRARAHTSQTNLVRV